MHLTPLLSGLALPFLGEIVALFVASVLIAYTCYRLHLVPIAGFLIAGAVLGPYALGVVEDIDLVNQLAEIGVILLLFTIGIEFSLEELKEIGSFIFTGGAIQSGVTVLVTAGALLIFGIDWRTGVFTGCLVALSSTAVVLGLLSERAETDTPRGRHSLGILIFQDLAIVGMVLAIPLLGGRSGGSGVLFVLGKAVLLVAVILFLARLVVPKVLEWIARSRRQELFLLTVVTICFGTAWITSLAGVSLALGAFLAGLVVSESRYREYALSEILPLKTIFNALFFVSVGMLFNIGFLIQNPLIILAVAAGIILVKWIITSSTILVLGFPARIAFATGLILAQIGEFSFVLNSAGRDVGLSFAGMGIAGEQAFIAVTVLLMLITPFEVQAAPALGAAISRMWPTERLVANRKDSADEPTYEDHVIVVGYGPAGRRLVQVLRNTGLNYIVLEMNPASVAEAAREGVHIMYGDAARRPILEAAGIEHAKIMVVAINDRSATMRTVSVARYENPTLQIIARTRFLAEVERLQRIGADIVVPEEMETTVRLFSHVLNAYMIPPEEVARQVDTIRADDYGVVRGSIQEAHMMVLQGLDEEGLHTRAVAVRKGAPVDGKTLAELELRKTHGITVLAVRRASHTIGSPAGTFRVQAGDRLVLIGMAEQFSRCSTLFRLSTDNVVE